MLCNYVLLFLINNCTWCTFTQGFIVHCVEPRVEGEEHRRSMEKEAKANRRHCFMGENCRAHASIQTV